MRKVVEFTKNFATKTKGDKCTVGSMLARQLVDRKVAKYETKKVVVTKK